MIPDKAIELLTKEKLSWVDLADVDDAYWTAQEYLDAYEMAIAALKKQIPKKPELVNDLVYEKYACSCGNVLALKCVEYTKGRYRDFCDVCGRAIDWTEEAEE